MSTVDELTFKEIKRIVKEAKEAVSASGSQYAAEQEKILAFHAILIELDWNEKQNKEESEDAREAMRDAVTASKYLDDNEDTIAGRWHS